jgi:hypothetical protein
MSSVDICICQFGGLSTFSIPATALCLYRLFIFANTVYRVATQVRADYALFVVLWGSVWLRALVPKMRHLWLDFGLRKQLKTLTIKNTIEGTTAFTVPDFPKRFVIFSSLYINISRMEKKLDVMTNIVANITMLFFLGKV